MFSIKRYGAPAEGGDAGGSAPSWVSIASGSKIAERIQKLQERANKKRKFDEADFGTTRQGGTLEQVTGTTIPSALPPNLNIHPSRLQAAPALRASQDRVKGAGKQKEKTTAKQRYLNKKKERRKAREKSKKTAGSIKPGEGKKKKSKDKGKEKEEDGSESSEEESEEELEEGKKDDTLVDLPSGAKGKRGQVELEEVRSDEEDASSSSGSTSGSEDEAEGHSKDGTPEVDPASVSQQALQVGPETPSALAVETTSPTELQPFPEPRALTSQDPALLRNQGLPQGFAKPVLVDPSLTEDLDAHSKAEGKQESGISCVQERTRARLQELGIQKLFAVQASVVPLILSAPDAHNLYPTYRPPRDICVSAPTGSGKTLAYCIPMVEVLRSRIIPRVRALILLPTRDLVVQVRETLESVGKGSGLKIASVTGVQSFAHEQSVLVDHAGESLVDIVIATPGRLIDHVDSTPGFTLQHLRFLVLDEADRLLGQSFNDWLPRLLAALDPQAEKAAEGSETASRDFSETPRTRSLGSNSRRAHREFDEDSDKEMRHVQAMAPAWLQARAKQLKMPTSTHPTELSVQKLLFSATLTRDPAKMAALKLRKPVYVSVRAGKEDEPAGAEYAIPDTLREHMIITTATDKPMVLVHLASREETPIRQALVFTKSVEAAKRLHKLMEFFASQLSEQSSRAVKSALYSSELTSAERSNVLRAFRSGEIDLIICSDLISRGIDISDVQHVISYDIPVDMRKYVHRVGRTARAGKTGDAWSLVEEQEARHFKAMLSHGGRMQTTVKEKVKKEALDSLREPYEKALTKLSQLFGKH